MTMSKSTFNQNSSINENINNIYKKIMTENQTQPLISEGELQREINHMPELKKVHLLPSYQ